MEKPDIKQIIAEYIGVPLADVQDHTKLEDDLGADSLDILDMIHHIEEVTGWDICNKEIKAVHTVADMQALVDKHWEAEQDGR